MWEAVTEEEQANYEHIIGELQQHYEAKQMLQVEIEQLNYADQTFDLHSTGRRVSFDEAQDEIERRFYEAKKRVAWLEDIAVQDTTFRSEQIMKKVEVAVPDLAKQSEFGENRRERQRLEQLMQMLSFDGDDPDEKFDHLMKQIGGCRTRSTD